MFFISFLCFRVKCHRKTFSIKSYKGRLDNLVVNNLHICHTQRTQHMAMFASPSQVSHTNRLQVYKEFELCIYSLLIMTVSKLMYPRYQETLKQILPEGVVSA